MKKAFAWMWWDDPEIYDHIYNDTLDLTNIALNSGNLQMQYSEGEYIDD